VWQQCGPLQTSSSCARVIEVELSLLEIMHVAAVQLWPLHSPQHALRHLRQRKAAKQRRSCGGSLLLLLLLCLLSCSWAFCPASWPLCVDALLPSCCRLLLLPLLPSRRCNRSSCHSPHAIGCSPSCRRRRGLPLLWLGQLLGARWRRVAAEVAVLQRIGSADPPGGIEGHHAPKQVQSIVAGLWDNNDRGGGRIAGR